MLTVNTSGLLFLVLLFKVRGVLFDFPYAEQRSEAH